MADRDAIAQLENLRSRIDQIDSDLIALLGERFETIRQVAEHKRDTNINVMQPTRVKEVFKSRIMLAEKAKLRPKLVEQLWTTIITHACQVENQVGQLVGGELLFQGMSLDHGMVDVDDLELGCELLCSRLSFEIEKQCVGAPIRILRGGNIRLIVRQRSRENHASRSKSYLAFEVHSVQAAIHELKRRGNEVHELETLNDLRMATVILPEPVGLLVAYVEKGPGTSLGDADYLHLSKLVG